MLEWKEQNVKDNQTKALTAEGSIYSRARLPDETRPLLGVEGRVDPRAAIGISILAPALLVSRQDRVGKVPYVVTYSFIEISELR